MRHVSTAAGRLPSDAGLDVAHHPEVDVCQPVARHAQQVPRMRVRMVEAPLQNLYHTLTTQALHL